MRDYVKTCIPDPVITHVGTNDLNSETTPEKIVKSIADVARNIKTENRSVSISRIVPCNNNLNNTALEVNQEVLKTCEEAKFDYVDHKNINPQTLLNKSIDVSLRKTNSSSVFLKTSSIRQYYAYSLGRNQETT